MSYITVDRSFLADNINDYIHSYNRDKILVIKAYPGIGKTISTMDLLFKENLINIYLSPTHNLSGEVSNKFNIKHMMGKKYYCINKEVLKLSSHCNNDIYCRYFCPYYNNCEYYLIIKDLYSYTQSWIGVHSHLKNLYSNYVEKNEYMIDMTIIDETFSNSLIVNTKISRESLIYNKSLCEYDEFNFFIKEILNIMDDCKDIDEFYLKELLSGLNRKEMEKNAKNVDRVITESFLRKEKLDNKYNIFYTFMEIADLASKERLNQKFFEFKNNNIIDILYSNYLENKGSTILLDATFDESINSKFFDNDTKFEIIEYKESYLNHQKRYQFKSDKRFTYPISTLIHNKEYTSSFFTLCKLTKLIAEKHCNEDILVISRKKHGIMDKIKEFINLPNVEYINYGASRGINKYENFSVVILFGTPFPNPYYIERRAKMLGVDESTLSKIEKEDEMLQSLFRIRPLNKSCSIYILSSVDIFNKDKDIIYMTPNEMIKFIEKRLPICISRYSKIKNDIFEHIKLNKIVRKSELRNFISGDNNLISNSISELIEDGYIEEYAISEGIGRPKIYLKLIN